MMPFFQDQFTIVMLKVLCQMYRGSLIHLFNTTNATLWTPLPHMQLRNSHFVHLQLVWVNLEQTFGLYLNVYQAFSSFFFF